MATSNIDELVDQLIAGGHTRAAALEVIGSAQQQSVVDGSIALKNRGADYNAAFAFLSSRAEPPPPKPFVTWSLFIWLLSALIFAVPGGLIDLHDLCARLYSAQVKASPIGRLCDICRRPAITSARYSTGVSSDLPSGPAIQYFCAKHPPPDKLPAEQRWNAKWEKGEAGAFPLEFDACLLGFGLIRIALAVLTNAPRLRLRFFEAALGILWFLVCWFDWHNQATRDLEVPPLPSVGAMAAWHVLGYVLVVVGVCGCLAHRRRASRKKPAHGIL